MCLQNLPKDVLALLMWEYLDGRSALNLQDISNLRDRLEIPDNTCVKCQKKFDTFVKLKAHEAKDIPCDFVCQICDKQCYNRHKYYRHMKEHT